MNGNSEIGQQSIVFYYGVTNYMYKSWWIYASSRVGKGDFTLSLSQNRT